MSAVANRQMTAANSLVTNIILQNMKQLNSKTTFFSCFCTLVCLADSDISVTPATSSWGVKNNLNDVDFQLRKHPPLCGTAGEATELPVN